VVILCTASQGHLSWEKLQFLSELFFFFSNEAVKGKKNLIKISTQTDKEKTHFNLCICRCNFSQISETKGNLEYWPVIQSKG